MDILEITSELSERERTCSEKGRSPGHGSSVQKWSPCYPDQTPVYLVYTVRTLAVYTGVH